LRLFAPPLWQVSLPRHWQNTAAVEPRSSLIRESALSLSIADKPLDELPAVVELAPVQVAPAEPPSIATVLGTVWLLGTITCLGITTIRWIAFHRLLRFACPAPLAWQGVSDRLARRMGLRRGPQLWLMRGPLSPLMWFGFGRASILLPADLAVRLDGRRRAAILAHELAHFRRGDHWVRWLEVLATAVYWWNPLVWLARRGLREAEEQCCDAWVVWALPAARRVYADALIDTADFLSRAQPAVPALASGLGTVRHLRRRIVMIMRGGVPHRLTRSGAFLALTIGIALLAFSPGRAQDRDDDPQPDAPRPKTARKSEDARPDPRQMDDMAELRQHVRDLRRQLADAERKLEAFENGRFSGSGTGAALPGRNRPRAGGIAGTAPVAPGAPAGGVTAPLLPTTPAPPAPPALPGTPPPPQPRAPGSAEGGRDPDGRMRALERELADLRREIAEMRRDMRRRSENASERGPSRP
ncbi:MAG TPA: M56 family metallopeptidase, partial [Gemmataceae bacterium]|nr:M56 family metallopeptidase [Gemmataceae bacterium]